MAHGSKSPGAPELVGALFRDLAANDPVLKKRFAQYEIWDLWPDVVGHSIALHSRPQKFHESVLVVEVDHSSWMQELMYLKPGIMAKLHARIDRHTIRDIRFVLRASKK